MEYCKLVSGPNTCVGRYHNEKHKKTDLLMESTWTTIQSKEICKWSAIIILQTRQTEKRGNGRKESLSTKRICFRETDSFSYAS